jgi:hypothetical protein
MTEFEECPDCGDMSLVWHDDLGIYTCLNPDCDFEDTDDEEDEDEE